MIACQVATFTENDIRSRVGVQPFTRGKVLAWIVGGNLDQFGLIRDFGSGIDVDIASTTGY